LLSRLYGADFLRYTNLLHAENVKHHHRPSKHARQDWLRTPPILKVTELRVALGAGLMLDLAQLVSEPIFDISRLVEAARRERSDPFLGGGSTIHAAPISTSGGRLVLTRPLVLAIAHLSNLAIRVASASTNASRSASAGRD
jgi:hypothetical protein